MEAQSLHLFLQAVSLLKRSNPIQWAILIFFIEYLAR